MTLPDTIHTYVKTELNGERPKTKRNAFVVRTLEAHFQHSGMLESKLTETASDSGLSIFSSMLRCVVLCCAVNDSISYIVEQRVS